MTRTKGSKNGQGLGPRAGLNLRISKADRAGFDAAAARAGVKTSEWARTILRREAGLWTGQKEDGMETKRYYYWIGTRNAGGGIDATGENGHVDATSAKEACEEVRDEYLKDSSDGLTVCARLDDMSETAELDL